jgi:SAM-dependent methyltransferase
MRGPPWNHNLAYHRLILDASPQNCRRALDVGCGRGALTRRLADVCAEVIGIDCCGPALCEAERADRIQYVEGDAMTHHFEAESFDLIAAVATLHHLPLGPSLERFRTLLRPGGILAVVGLYRFESAFDYAAGRAAVPVSWTLRRWRGEAAVGAPLQEPIETLGEIRAAARDILPGAAVRRRFFFRYSLIWQK